MRISIYWALLLGGACLILGLTVSLFFVKQDTNSEQEIKPLYWVAPMDSNYRRDQPGLSPMGMELIPVYAESTQPSPGIITIQPSVINNLGVRTTQVIKAKLEHTIIAPGLLQYDEHGITHIHPRVDGWIEKLHIKSSGEPVKKGQALYDLYSPELVNAQQEYLAELKRNHTQLIEAAKQRLKSLQVSDAFIDSLSKQQTIKQTITFYAPQSGVVEHLNIRQGYYVQPSKTLMSIASLDSIWVEAQIYPSQITHIKSKQTVYMTTPSIPGKQWSGNVDYIYPALDETSHTLRVRIRFANQTQELKPGMLSQLTFLSKQEKPNLIIPLQALIQTGKDERVVLALGNGQFKSISVISGLQTQTHIEILKGLSEGEAIVSSGQFLLDSESSKNSDFKRLSHPLVLPSATVKGKINSINLINNTINIHRGPIEKWNRPATTMDFILSKDLNQSTLQRLKSNQTIHFSFEIDNGNFIITDILNTAE